jgi:hypothetical protein
MPPAPMTTISADVVWLMLYLISGMRKSYGIYCVAAVKNTKIVAVDPQYFHDLLLRVYYQGDRLPSIWYVWM